MVTDVLLRLKPELALTLYSEDYAKYWDEISEKAEKAKQEGGTEGEKDNNNQSGS